MKLIVKSVLVLILFSIFGCSQNKDNYTVTKPFIMPNEASKLTSFNDLYPTGDIKNVDSKAATDQADKYLNPPSLG